MNLLDLIFPKKCLECNKDGKYMCDSCISKILDGTFDKNNFAVFKYKGVIRKAILSLKYKFASDIADELIGVSVGRLNSSKFHKVTLVPIPLYKQRENWRGFNQSGLLGQKLAVKMKWEFAPDLLIRTKNAHPQVSLKGDERRKNLSGVFSVNSDLTTYYMLHDAIVLFDDVYTTGSTIKEAKKVLEKAGFKNIYSLTIAR